LAADAKQIHQRDNRNTGRGQNNLVHSEKKHVMMSSATLKGLNVCGRQQWWITARFFQSLRKAPSQYPAKSRAL